MSVSAGGEADNYFRLYELLRRCTAKCRESLINIQYSMKSEIVAYRGKFGVGGSLNVSLIVPESQLVTAIYQALFTTDKSLETSSRLMQWKPPGEVFRACIWKLGSRSLISYAGANIEPSQDESDDTSIRLHVPGSCVTVVLKQYSSYRFGEQESSPRLRSNSVAMAQMSESLPGLLPVSYIECAGAKQ